MESVKKPKIRVVPNANALADAALECFVEHLEKHIAEKGIFRVAVSGGHTPDGFFRLLGKSTLSHSIPWDKIQLFWVDERCVPPEADESNYGRAASLFLNSVPIPPGNVHRISGEISDMNAAVKEYEQTIRRIFNIGPDEIPSFDLIFLGMGKDGHIGSLFPNSNALFDTTDIVTPVYFMSGELNRITLTIPVISSAKHLVILISGAEKAKIVKEVLCSEPDEVKFPVHTLWPILDRVTWIIDAPAAQYISDLCTT